jgi:hypothetical protein
MKEAELALIASQLETMKIGGVPVNGHVLNFENSDLAARWQIEPGTGRDNLAARVKLEHPTTAQGLDYFRPAIAAGRPGWLGE